MESTTVGQSEITITSPVISYTYPKLTDEKEFVRNLAARIYGNSGFVSIETGKPIDANTVAKDAINKALIFWESLPSEFKKE